MGKKFFCFLAGFVALLALPALGQDCDLTGYRLFIDPGHGGSDSGAVGPTGYFEKTATLYTGLYLRDWLQYLGATVGMSRTTDATVSLTARATAANNFRADRFISVHYNSFTNPSVDGTETFVVPNATARTRNLGQSVLNELVAYLGTFNRGLKTANFTVLVRTAMPATLAESVFISNPDEEAALQDPNYLSYIAAAQAQGLCDHLSAFPTGAEDAAAEEDSRDALSLTSLSLGDDAGARARDDRARVDLTQPVTLRTVAVIGDDRFFLDPQFSPDGRFLVFAEQGRRGLYLVNTSAAHLAPRRLASSDLPFNSPAPPPNSARVFAREGTLWIDRAGQTAALLQDDMRYLDATPSPDGSYVLTQVSHPQGAFLFSVDTQSGVAYNLSWLGVGREGRYNLSYEGAWSPDGQHVLLNVIKDDGYTVLSSELYITDPTGRQLQRLSGGGPVKLHAVWSAQNQIAFDDGEGRIVLAELHN